MNVIAVLVQHHLASSVKSSDVRLSFQTFELIFFFYLCQVVSISAQLMLVSCSFSQQDNNILNKESELQHLGAVVFTGDSRQERSLLNTFPFTEAKLESSPREVKQRDDVGVDFNSVAASPERCIDKIEMQEETEYDEVVTCDHSYDKRCTTSYTTTYEAQQEEECDENYR